MSFVVFGQKSSLIRIYAACLFLVLLSSTVEAGVFVAIGNNFTGSRYGVNSTYKPPDGDGCIGPGYFIEFVNGFFSIYSKTNGSRVQSMTDLNFWSSAGVSITSGWEVTDPRVLFDPASQRWFASQADFDPTDTINSNHFLLAISVTNDPTKGWKGVKITGDPTGVNFADFPTLGFDANGVYLAGDMFDPSGNGLSQSTLVSVPKSDLLLTTPTAANRTLFSGLPYSSWGAILQPAVCRDGSGSGVVLAMGDLGYDLGQHSTLFDFKVLNAASHSASLSGANTVNVPAYTIPPDPYQPGGSSNLDDGDTRFSSIITCVGGNVYAVHGTQFNNNAALQWFRFNATNMALLETGIISDPVLDLYYGSIAVNPSGTVVIACNGSSPSNYISSYAFVGATVSGVTTFNSKLLLRSSTVTYQSVDPTTGLSRWGDYSSTSVDPLDPTRFWTLQLYAASSTAWATQITELITAPPMLSVAQSGANVILSWPSYGGGFTLQGTTNIGVSNTWTTVSQARTTNNGVISVSVPMTASRFFRLIL
jgi:hypothetical protein